MKKIILVNQTANYLFADIITAFANKLPQCTVEAWYGTFDYDVKKLPANVQLATGPAYDRTSFSKRFRSWVRFYLWMMRMMSGVDKRNTAFFFVSNPPLFVFLPGITRLKFDCLIYDLYPDVLAGLNQTNFIKNITKRWQRRNRKVLQAAQTIYTIGSGLKEAITAYLPAGLEDKVEIVPVWNKKEDKTGYISTRDFRREWGLENKKVILYSGNIGLTHPLEYLVELASWLQAKGEWQIVIVGQGGKKTQLVELARGMNNVMFHDPVPFTDLQALLSIADWGYVTLDSSATNTSVPSKTYNLLAAGIPILALVNEKSDIAELIDNYKVGISFTETEMDKTIDAITSLSAIDHTLLCNNAKRCSQHFTSALADRFTKNWVTANV